MIVEITFREVGVNGFRYGQADEVWLPQGRLDSRWGRQPRMLAPCRRTSTRKWSGTPSSVVGASASPQLLFLRKMASVLEFELWRGTCKFFPFTFETLRRFLAVDRLSLSNTRVWDQRECLKFICKDVWMFLFKKTADRLQTNRRVSCHTIRW